MVWPETIGSINQGKVRVPNRHSAKILILALLQRTLHSYIPHQPANTNKHSLLGICMHIRCLMRSTWKVRNGKARSAGEMTPCCPPPIHSRISERSKWLRWWGVSRFLSPLACRLSSFCWAVNIHLDSFWRHLLSSESSTSISIVLRSKTRSPCHRAWWHPEWHVPKGK